MTAMSLAKILFAAGVGLILAAGLVYLAARLGIQLGRLPGDIRIERENISFFFPLTTMLLISLVLSLVLNVIFRLFNR
jgi:hypothetical protein